MKKKFLKVALFSLVMGLPVTTLVGCKDYDDDITYLTDQNDKLQQEFNNKLEQQVKALDAKIDELNKAKTDLEQQVKLANEAAAKAAEAAKAAQKSGDDALAEAMTANTKAEAALAAVEQAKLDAIAETTAQVKALKESIEGQLAELKSEYGKQFDQIAGALNNCATTEQLNKAVAELEKKIAESGMSEADVNKLIKAYLEKISINETTISAINGQIDAIGQDIEKINLAVAGNSEKIADVVDKVIPGIKADLTTLSQQVADHIRAYNAYKTSVDGQLAALNTFKQTYETLLAGLGEKLDGLDTKIGDVKSDLSALQDELAKLTNAENGLITSLSDTVAEHTTRLGKIEENINGIQNKLKDIDSNLNLLAQKSSKRLSSITLVPTAYRDGIPTIEFYSAEYKAMGKLDKATGLYAAPAANAAKKNIISESTEVLFRLNPSGVELEDIEKDQVAFVQTIATSRAADDVVVEVVTTGLEKRADGILAVPAKKAEAFKDKNVDQAGAANKIYTIALKVPIAEKNLYTWTEGEGEEAKTVTEDKADAVVYSEYARVSDTQFTPSLTATSSITAPDYKESNLYAFDAVTSADVLTKVNYQSTTDLNQYVAGCMNIGTGSSMKHLTMSAEEMAQYGLTMEYSVFDKKYFNAANDQAYATVTKEGVLTPAGDKLLERLGKTPVIEVVLKHGNDVIAQKFFKVELSLGDAETMFKIEFPQFPLQCSSKVYEVTWKQINDVIISQLGFPMTKDEFVSNYTATATANSGVTVDLSATGLPSAEGADDAVQPITWTIGVADMTLADGSNNFNLVRKVKFTPTASLYPELELTLTSSVVWPNAMPELGATVGALWKNNTLTVLPQAMPANYNSGMPTVTYDTNILQGRKTPYLTNLLSCSTWDIVFKTAPAGYEVDEENEYNIVLPGENETAPAVKAAVLWYDDTDHAALLADEATDADLEARFSIENNEAGIAMVEGEMTVGLGWNYTLAEKTATKQLNNTYLKIVKPLKQVNVSNIEPIIQNSIVQTRDLATNMTITDAFNNVFGQYEPWSTSETAYWQYYDIQSVKWLNDKMTVTYQGKDYTLKELNLQFTVSQNGELTYTGGGAALQEEVTLNVPVEVTHKWGVLKGSNAVVHVTIKPGLN